MLHHVFAGPRSRLLVAKVLPARGVPLFCMRNAATNFRFAVNMCANLFIVFLINVNIVQLPAIKGTLATVAAAEATAAAAATTCGNHAWRMINADCQISKCSHRLHKTCTKLLCGSAQNQNQQQNPNQKPNQNTKKKKKENFRATKCIDMIYDRYRNCIGYICF